MSVPWEAPQELFLGTGAAEVQEVRFRQITETEARKLALDWGKTPAEVAVLFPL